MKKVVYSVSRAGKKDSTKFTGLGYLAENDLITACISQNQKPYIRIFEDCLKSCHKIRNTQNEYKGSYYEIREIEIESKNGSKDTREVELTYNIWFKILD